MSVKKAMAQALLPSMVIGAMAMGSNPYADDVLRVSPTSSEPRPQGYEPKGKSDDELARHKAHRKKLQAKRNARKGVYANKIKYPKKRG
jgi:hypothetical protein